MANSNIEPFECLVRKEALFDYEEGFGEYLACVVFGVKTLRGYPLLWIVQLENGYIYHPILTSALCHKECEPMEDTEVERWDNPSHQSEVIIFGWLKGQRMTITLPNRQQLEGEYLFTIDFYGTGEAESGSSLGHKHKHIIELDNGNYVAYPNTFIRGYSKCFTDSDEVFKPKVAIRAWEVDCEGTK